MRDYNEALMREAELLRPDLFFVFKGSWVRPETIRKIRSLDCICVQFYPDTGFATHSPYLLDALVEYDWIFSTKPNHPEWLHETLGIEFASFLPHAYDPEVHFPPAVSDQDRRDYSCDISFIGNISSKKRRALEFLVARRPQLTVRVWGPPGWGSVIWPCPDTYSGGEVWGMEYSKALCLSSINLGLLFEGNSDGAAPDLITARTFEIPAAGGFLLHERTPELQRYFQEGKECACFHDFDELIEKIDYYLSHSEERVSIAAEGRRRCMRSNYSVDDRAGSVIEKYTELCAKNGVHRRET